MTATTLSNSTPLTPEPTTRQRQSLLRTLLRQPGARIGLVILLLFAFVAVFAEQVAPYSIQQGDLASARKPPAWLPNGSLQHLLGTDQLGQDVFSRVVYGTRVSLSVSFLGVALAVLLGLTLGTLAGYVGGWVDRAISAGVNLLLSVPYLIVVLVAAAILGRSLLNVILIFGITDAPVFIRLVRGEVLRIRSTEFITAAHSIGAGHLWIIREHVLPNVFSYVVALATFEMSAMIFYEAGLSFLGLSVPPSVPSWGNMLSLGRNFLPVLPWVSIVPGLAIALLSLGVNLFGEGLQKALDPRRYQ
jgi:ABC-type dipeptide/oligopeptide/nickel transport system permease subunit